MYEPSELSRRQMLAIGSAIALAAPLTRLTSVDWASAATAPDPSATAVLRLTGTLQTITLTHEDGFQQSIGTLLPELIFTEGAVTDLAPTSFQHTTSATGSSITYQYPTVPVGGVGVRPTLTVQQSSADGQVRAWLDIDLAPGRALTLERLTVLRFATTETLQPFGPGEDWQSRPLLFPHFFCGVEYPVADAGLTGTTVTLGHAPGKQISAGGSFRSHQVVIGGVGDGRSVEAFQAYFWSSLRNDERPPIHVNYNGWWTMSVVDEQHAVDLINAVMPAGSTGPHFDSFTLDMGWSTAHGIWAVDPGRFPNGLGPISQLLQKRGSALGLWWSPSNWYSPSSFDNDWAAANGYETFGTARWPCLAKGTRYQRDTLAQFREYATTLNLAQIKFDGYSPECPASDHGHLPGPLSREAIAAGIIEIFEMFRAAQPEIWLETTCFRDASPWWQRWTDSVIGGWGDDKPPGVVPAPTYQQSYTSARDFFVLSQIRTDLVPVATEEDLGIIEQTAEPGPDDDAVVAGLRGHHFLPMYVNPYVAGQPEMSLLGGLERWLRANTKALDDTIPIYPASWPAAGSGSIGLDQLARLREPYGYAHPGSTRSIVLLRNPWIDTATVTVPPDALPDGPMSVVQLYPAPRGIARSIKVRPDHGLPITLHAYETKVLVIEHGDSPATPAPDPGDNALAGLTVHPVTVADGADGLTANFAVDLAEAGWALHVLLECPTKFDIRTLTVSDGGVALDKTTTVLDSAGGFDAFSNPALRSNWWKYISTDLAPGRHDLTLKVATSGTGVSCSAWIIRRLLLPKDANRAVVDRYSFPLPPFPFVMAARQVFQATIPAYVRPHDIAIGKAATQSSAGFAPASLAVDGNTDGNFFDGSVSHTDYDVNAWWQVDLGQSYNIEEIDIWNRTDGTGTGRLTDYYVLVSEQPLPVSLPDALATAGAWVSHQPTQAQSPTAIEVGATGRYVRVQLAGTNYLHMAEVQVFATT